MVGLVLRRLAQTGIVLAPFAWVILRITPDLHPLLPVLITVVAVGVETTVDAFGLLIPHLSIVRFREEYLKAKLDEWQHELGSDIRINVMYVRRVWWRLFRQTFVWHAHRGYNPPSWHHDANLRLSVQQGVCGMAFRENTPLFVHLAPPSDPAPDRYKLSRRHVAKIRKVELKAILSVPIWRKVGDSFSPSWHPVGVINLDSTTPRGVQTLENNRQKLVDYLTEAGKLLALLPSRHTRWPLGT